MKRKCTKCKQEKSKEDFYKTIKRLDGTSSWCKECTVKKAKEGYKEKKEYLKNMFI